MSSNASAAALGLILLLGGVGTGSAMAASPGGAALIGGPKKNPALAPAGTYKLDRDHASVTVKVSHQGFSDFTFRFDKFDAAYDYDPKHPEATRVEVTLEPASLDAGDKKFEDTISGPNYFNTAKFAEMKFVSTVVKRKAGTNRGTMTGDLTWMGVTQPVTFAVTYTGWGLSMNKDKMGFSATTTVTRSQFGVKGLIPAVADKVAVIVEAEFAKS